MSLFPKLAGVACALFLHATTNAAVILQPTSASTNVNSYHIDDLKYFSPGNVIDQSGLSTPYTSLVTDFDTYTGAGVTAYHGLGESMWAADTGIFSANFDFDLGGSYDISAVAFWGLDADPSGVGKFEVLLSDDAGFAGAISAGTFTVQPDWGTNIDETDVQVFSFSQKNASFVRFRLFDTLSSTGAFSIGFNEAAFRVAEVPEPEGWALGLAGVFLVLIRRRSGQRN